MLYSRGPQPPGLRLIPSPWPIRNQAAQQEVSGGRASEASSAAPHRSPLLTLPPEPSPHFHGKIVFHKISPWCQKGWGPLLSSMVPSVVYFIHSINSVYVSIPISQFLPPHPFPPWYPYICSLHLCTNQTFG